MNILIYLIIIALFIVLILWTLNNTKDYETTSKRIAYIIIGLIVLTIATLTIFNISKIGIDYPSKEIMKQIRKISVLLFIPINGFISLPHIASIKGKISLGNYENSKMKKKIIILAIILIIVAIIESVYLKDFQNGIIQILKNK